MNYSRQHPFPWLFVIAVLAAIVSSSCGESPAPPPPPPPPAPFAPQSVTVKLGEHGGEITLMTTQSGGYTRNGEPFQSGTTIETEGNNYKLTLSDGKWSAEYVPPDPVAVALGTSGDALLISRNEDGSYQAGDVAFQSGEMLPPASNGNVYRLTLKDGDWEVEYVAPDPIAVELGASGEVLALVLQEDRSYSTEDGQMVGSGDTWNVAANGSDYRLTLDDGVWSAEYVPPEPSPVNLGTTGERVIVSRLEDGRYEANDEIVASGDILSASNGNMYRLTLVDSQWNAEYVVPDSISVVLGASGETLSLTFQEDRTYRTDEGQVIQSGDTWPVEATGSSYRLTLEDGKWSAAYVAPEPDAVFLGTTGQRVLVTRREDGRYEADGELISADMLVSARNGNMYRLILHSGEWTAEFVPQAFTVALGASGETISIVREEGGQYWLGRTPIEDGYIYRADGSRYKLSLRNGEWTASFIPETIQVQAGESGTVIVLQRLEDNTYVLDGEEVRSGHTVTRDGNEYVLTFSRNRWTAEFTAGTVEVELPGGRGSVTLVKQEDGSYTLDGRVLRPGTTRTIDGVRYRFTLDEDGWTVTRRLPPPTTGGSGSTGSGSGTTSDQTETDERNVSYGQSEFRLCDECADESATSSQGTILEVGTDTTNAREEYSLYELLGRSGIVTVERTYVEAARERIEAIVDRIKRYTNLYELDAIDPNEHINTGLDVGGIRQDGLWAQAMAELEKILGSSFERSNPWRGASVEFREVDDVVEELEEILDALGSKGAFEREFGLDADDYFGVPLARIKFGSTRSTRFGVYANKTETDSADAATETWGSSGAFAYTQLEQTTTGNLPARGAATYRGDTVAVDDAYELYSGTIELNARFSTQRVDGTITSLDNNDGRSWEHLRTAVESVQLPTASLDDTGRFSVLNDSASVRFPAGSRTEGSLAPVTGSSLQGLFVDEASEAFGTWSVGSVLEGSFGVTRASTGSVSGPSVNDRGAESETYLGSTAVPDSNGDIALASSSTEFKATDLYARKGGSDIEDKFVVTARATIESIRKQIVDATTAQDRGSFIADANTALASVFGSSNILQDPGTNADARELLRRVSNALGSASRFPSSLESGGVFVGQTVSVSAEDIFAAVPRALSVGFDYTASNYTRFGAWAETTLDNAVDTSPAVETGLFAYSALDSAPSSAALRFRAVYEGGTVAVDTVAGSLYRGFFQLAVDWTSGSTNTVSSFIRDLRNFRGSSRFQHSSQEVTLVEFLDVTVNDDGSLAAGGRTQVHYQGGQPQTFSGQGITEVEFVGESVDGPRGVLGSWSVSGIGLEGAFGAELIP